MKKKRQTLRSIPEEATSQAVRLIGVYGIEDAEIIAKLIYEKIVASRKSLKRKYGEK